jgi:hypothetical protein
LNGGAAKIEMATIAEHAVVIAKYKNFNSCEQSTWNAIDVFVGNQPKFNSMVYVQTKGRHTG